MKIVEVKRKPGIWQGYFTQNLEQAARALVDGMAAEPCSGSITTSLKQEIALVLEQMDRLSDLKKRQSRSLCRTECYVDTELMLMEARTPRYSSRRFPERDKLQKRLFDIEAERRKHSILDEDRLQELHRKLLSLMQKYGHLTLRSKSGLEELVAQDTAGEEA